MGSKTNKKVLLLFIPVLVLFKIGQFHKKRKTAPKVRGLYEVLVKRATSRAKSAQFV